MKDQPEIKVEEAPSAEDFQIMRKGLDDYNRQYAPDASFRRLDVFLRRPDGSVMGGLLGGTSWGWLHVDVVWVEEGIRDQGFGRRLMAAGEQEAIGRGCRYAFLETTNFQALDFYLKLGYACFGILEDLPAGHRTYFLRKSLVKPAPAADAEASRSTPAAWDESSSQAFIDRGRYFVPDRERQIRTMAALIPPSGNPFTVLELGCGQGLLAEAILEAQPQARVIGLDGSETMRQEAARRLARFEARFEARPFDLHDHEWRRPKRPVQAVVSSLAIHHLDDRGKEELAHDVFRMLSPGGVFVVADVVQPAGTYGTLLAAEEWDEAVRERALALDGHSEGFKAFQTMQWNMYRYTDPDDIDHPSRLYDQLRWLEKAGFSEVDVYWMRAGHAIFGGRKRGE